MDVEQVVYRLTADSTQYIASLDAAQARLIAFGVEAATALGKRAVNLTAEYQDAAVSFEVLTGSAQRGIGLLTDIQKLASVTPYVTKDLVQSARTLAGYGVSVENILPSLKAIGEVTAGAGGGMERLQRITLAFGQVMAKGIFKGEELRQFAEAGIGVKDFADTIGISTRKFLEMQHAGDIGAEVVVNTFNRLTSEGGRFAGTMVKLSQTINGRWNTVVETFDLSLLKIGNTIAGANNQQVGGLFDRLDEWNKTLAGNAESIGKDVLQFFNDVAPVIDLAESSAVAFWQTLKDINQMSKDIAVAADGAGLSFKNLFGLSRDPDFKDFNGAIRTIPSALSDVWHGGRSEAYRLAGDEAKLKGDALRDLGNVFDKIGLKGTRVDGIREYVGNFYQALGDEFKEQSKVDLGKTGETEKTLSKYFEGLFSTKPLEDAAARARAALDKISKIKADMDQATINSGLSISKKFGSDKKHYWADDFKRNLDTLNKAYDLDQKRPEDKRSFTPLIYQNTLEGMLNKIKTGLAKKRKKGQGEWSKAAVKGSSDTVDTINRGQFSRNNVKDTERETLELIQKLVEEQKEHNEHLKEIQDALKNIDIAGLIESLNL